MVRLDNKVKLVGPRLAGSESHRRSHHDVALFIYVLRRAFYGQLSPTYALLLGSSLEVGDYDAQDLLVPMLPQDVATLIGLPVNAGLM